ncbi:D-beta-hydroxybutyrate dehydrogenase, mitochondrial [Folsomia candida]|uniref:D-beta-hydroxybutyrate dehydrogenase, mitochondrial n=1 Tax=Folsomia candida TaxID=158441 RepID=A0A226D952_FOLCA|nr:D-beta-hydroxybutyrate dehydrogenase, mitochondrial [Folsomia candida]
MAQNGFDLKDVSLDVWERCIFWFAVSYVVANVGWFIGFSWFTLFFLVLIGGCAGVILIDRLHLDSKGKAVLITGCDTGFGFASAKKLHGMGYTVFAGVISSDTDGAKQLQKEFKTRMYTVPMNVTSDEDVTKALEYIKENLPADCNGIWALITNAGWSTFGEVEMVPLDVSPNPMFYLGVHSSSVFKIGKY